MKARRENHNNTVNLR